MADLLSDELERLYGAVSRKHRGPWRTEEVAGYPGVYVVLDINGATVIVTSKPELAKLITLLPDVCDGDLRGRDEGRAPDVCADVGRR